MRIGFAAFLALVLAVLTGGFFWWHLNTSPPDSVKLAKTQVFVVNKGESAASVAQRLQEAGLIRGSLTFRLLLYQTKTKIQAGDFRLNSGMTPREIAKELTHGTLDTWLTIIEGWRAEEITEKINSQLVTRNPQLSNELKGYEGSLFPDSYLIPKNATSGAVLKIVLANFEKKIAPLRPEINKKGLTLPQVLTLASIVEREAGKETDRPIVAGILVKRWQNDWPLQADATVQYLIGSEKCEAFDPSSGRGLRSGMPEVRNEKCDWWPKISAEDLKINSLYNTYLHRGLPPAPICNPSLSAIKAVIFSIPTDYWFYLSDSQGELHFAKTAEEQAENIRRYLKS